uniref:Kinesin motor domain-containing protein n=1 Tax=Heterorhabditis bacteriophora TaxID=37862 RepID=A0A1I7WJG5_HETBA
MDSSQLYTKMVLLSLCQCINRRANALNIGKVRKESAATIELSLESPRTPVVHLRTE